jgi:hypothetical protein
LAAHYYKRYGAEVRSPDGVRKLHDRFVNDREDSILDAAAATTALNAIIFRDHIDKDAITPQMSEAFRLAFPNKSIDDLNGLQPETAAGYLQQWKGKLFEVVVHDQFNLGEAVGDLQPAAGQIAKLASTPTQPGWDMEILNSDGTIATQLQLKATDSVSYVREALEKYPDIKVLTTSEVAEADQLTDAVLNSGVSKAELEAQVVGPMEDLLDSRLEEIGESLLPGLPFVLIVTTEGARVLMGQQTFQDAVNRSLERSFKTGAAIGVGALLSLVGAGIVSLPATFATRIGIDRYQLLRGLSRRLEADIDSVGMLRERPL